jgi:intein-encoded DNA endonuclease-like protein
MPIFKTANNNFFKTWSPEMAYVLGFFTADGNMIRNKRGAHFIEFQITDKDLLYKIRDLLKSNHKITERRRSDKWKNSYRLQIGSKEMFNSLINLGLTPNKSKTIDFPEIPKEYFSDFVRGYFDGDGCVTICNYIRKERNNKKCRKLLSGFVSGSENFLKSLHEKLKFFSGIKGGSFYKNKGYRLFFCDEDSLKLYNFMYNKIKSGLFLERKKNKFENYFGIKVC